LIFTLSDGLLSSRHSTMHASGFALAVSKVCNNITVFLLSC